MEYIRSSEFCERLRYVVSQAPIDFAEWHKGPGIKSKSIRYPSAKWLIGPYIMGNPKASGMIGGNKELLKNDAEISISTIDWRFEFSELLIITHRFNADTETGIITDQIKEIITKCLTSNRYDFTKNVKYMGATPMDRYHYPEIEDRARFPIYHRWHFQHIQQSRFWGHTVLGSFALRLNATKTYDYHLKSTETYDASKSHVIYIEVKSPNVIKSRTIRYKLLQTF